MANKLHHDHMASKLHQLYVSRVRIDRGEVGDPEDHGVNGFGNQVQCVASNLLFAIAFHRRLRVGSRMVLRSFTMPPNVTTGAHGSSVENANDSNAHLRRDNGRHRAAIRRARKGKPTPLSLVTLQSASAVQTRWWRAAAEDVEPVMRVLEPLLLQVLAA
jgi:hypothetical protein